MHTSNGERVDRFDKLERCGMARWGIPGERKLKA
jgi:hypothetical protein